MEQTAPIMKTAYQAMLEESARRREQAGALRAEGKTFQEIGGALGVSTERARQIVEAFEKQKAKACST